MKKYWYIIILFLLLGITAFLIYYRPNEAEERKTVSEMTFGKMINQETAQPEQAISVFSATDDVYLSFRYEGPSAPITVQWYANQNNQLIGQETVQANSSSYLSFLAQAPEGGVVGWKLCSQSNV